jgi:SAM-dependent methyltransferase
VLNPFADHFSGVAAGYATHRPSYPDALFDWLGSLAPARDVAWDCAAGSGQATLALTAHFGRVFATDASDAQLRSAPSHPRVEYRVATAEASGLPAATVDLITVAQAVHWFDFDRFHAEVRRVARKGGILAVWSYGLHRIDGAAIDRAIHRFYTDVVGEYWPPERRLIEEGYRTIPFPFPEIVPPAFEMMSVWTLAQLLGYLRTWSSVSRYREARGEDPVTALGDELSGLWGAPGQTRQVVWPLALRVGRVE